MWPFSVLALARKEVPFSRVRKLNRMPLCRTWRNSPSISRWSDSSVSQAAFGNLSLFDRVTILLFKVVDRILHSKPSILQFLDTKALKGELSLLKMAQQLVLRIDVVYWPIPGRGFASIILRGTTHFRMANQYITNRLFMRSSRSL